MPHGSEPRRGRGALESDVLTALWAAHEPLTVAQVQQAVADDLAHTTVHTILARLCEKDAVAREWTGRSHTYRPVLAEPDLAARQMRRLLDREADRGAVLNRFVAELPAEDETALLAAVHRLRNAGPSGGA